MALLVCPVAPVLSMWRDMISVCAHRLALTVVATTHSVLAREQGRHRVTLFAAGAAGATGQQVVLYQSAIFLLICLGGWAGTAAAGLWLGCSHGAHQRLQHAAAAFLQLLPSLLLPAWRGVGVAVLQVCGQVHPQALPRAAPGPGVCGAGAARGGRAHTEGQQQKAGGGGSVSSGLAGSGLCACWWWWCIESGRTVGG